MINANVARLFVAGVILAVTAAAADERLTEEQLPIAVRQTLQGTHLGGTLKQITRQVMDGRLVFEVEIEREKMPNRHLRIAEDGSFVREPVVPFADTGKLPVTLPELEFEPPLRLEDLPRIVQETAKTQARGRQIADIDRETWNGRSVYEVEFKSRGPNARIYIGEDGRLVREPTSRGQNPGYLGLQLQQTPPAVQAAVRKAIGDREIVDIDRKLSEAGPIYRVELKAPNGAEEVRVREDGTVLGSPTASR